MQDAQNIGTRPEYSPAMNRGARPLQPYAEDATTVREQSQFVYTAPLSSSLAPGFLSNLNRRPSRASAGTAAGSSSNSLMRGSATTAAQAIPGSSSSGGGDSSSSGRELSRSHFVPRSLEGYERHLRKIHCEGYLERLSRCAQLH
jgi:hypothetical protein